VCCGYPSQTGRLALNGMTWCKAWNVKQKNFLVDAMRASLYKCSVERHKPKHCTTDMTLTHDQLIRVKSFRNFNRIRVRTQQGVTAQFGPKPCNEHGELAWTIQESSVLTANYTGKQADLDAKRAEIAAAVEIENGQQIEIEGRHYTVRVVGENFFDPVSFIPDATPL
jgi:hypothetical protein